MSNVLFPVGTLIAERLMYIPSVGYLLPLVCFFNASYIWLTKKPTLSAGARVVGLAVWGSVIAGMCELIYVLLEYNRF